MARKTKEDALATRNALLDAAERVFHVQGVAHTTLNDIAQAAGTTRGAIYWHFENKADLFEAMMQRAMLPMDQALAAIEADRSDSPLTRIELLVRNCVRFIEHDERNRRVFEIAVHKAEYVGELLALKHRQQEDRLRFITFLAGQLTEAAAQQGVTPRMAPLDAARSLHALLYGLMHDWFIAGQPFSLSTLCEDSVQTVLRGLGLQPQPQPGTERTPPRSEARLQ